MPKMALCRSNIAFLRLNSLPKFSNPLRPAKFLTHGRNLDALWYKTRLPRIVGCRIFCKKPDSESGGKTSARLVQMNQLLQDSEERAANDNEPIPKITLEDVKVSFARSGGAGGQNVNKVNTKVDMRFNVAAADWLSPRIQEKILQMEKNRINSDGQLVISSTKTRTQKGNIEDALGKLQAIIDAAAYVPPPPSAETKKKIKKLAGIAEQKRLKTKKFHSEKKSMRRNKSSWD